MGKLDKNKQLAKTKKIPIRVNPAWYDIIIEYKNSHPDSVLHAATEALEKFAADADATWDQQTLYLKEAEKALETRPNKSSKSATSNIRLAPPSASQIHSVIEPIACAAYFAAPEVPPRRHCIPIIDICHALLPSTCFLREYDHYITHDIASPYAAQPVAQKALAIYTTLDFSLGTTVVRQRLLETIRYLVECLGVAVQKAEAMIPEDRESQGPPATAEPEAAGSQTSRALILQQIMSDVQYTTKTLLALLSRHPGDLRPLFDIRSAMPEDHRLISRLLDYSITVCTHARLYTNECGQLSGMAIAAVLDLLGDPEFVRETTLELFFVAPESSSPRAKALIQNLGVIVPADVKGELGWLDDDAPMLNIVKGLLANLGKPVLLTPIPKSLQFLKKGLISPRYPSNLHHLLFTAIAHFCSQSNLDQQCKVVAFETMAIWLTTTRDLLQESNDKRFGTPFTNGFVDTIRSVLDENASDQVLGYVWNLWDDPVDAIQHKVRSIFETLLEVVDIRSQIEDTRETYQMFLGKLLARLMRMDWHRKVKFALLSLLLPKIGTEPFLAAQPDLVWQTLQVHSSLVLAPRASSLLISFLEQRWQETKSAGGRSPGNEDVKQSREEVIEAWTQLWLSSLCRSLTSSSDVLRRNIVGHALQAIFKICPESFWKVVHVLERREVGKWSSPLSEYMITDEAYRMNALIAVIKVGRSLDLIEGDSYANDELPTNPHQISIQTLLTAIHHVDPNLRIDTLGLICESRKSTAEVTRVEIDLLRAFLPLNMNCTSPDFRQKFSGHITKFFTRLRGSLFAQYRNYQSRLAYVQKNTQKPQANIQAAQAESVAIKATIDYAHNFLLWLVEHIAASLYPGSSYQRISTALRLLSLLIKIFGIDRTPAPEGFAKAAEFPFQLPIATVRNVKLLLDCLTNPFDGNRMQAYEVLVAFPCPLPGFEEREEVQRLLWWALESVTSTRAGESDGGAIVFRLIFVKYVVGLGFDLDVEVAKASELVGTNHERGSNVRQESAVFKISAIAFAHKLCNLLQKQINIASTNLLRAAQSHPMHGSLLALQYLFSELDYNSALVKDNLVLWRRTHDQVILLVNRVCATVMDVLSNPSPEGNMPASFQEMEETIEEMIEELEEGDFDGTAIRESGPKHQVILSCCWRAVKEASSLLGVILLRAPLAVSKKDSSAFLDHEDIVDSGNLFRNLLTSIRHRGAFSAVYPSYVSLCARLLSAPQASFSDLPSIWLQDHIANITSSNISVTRRSAGLPLCILAIVSGEPAYRKPLLTATMKRLVKIASEGPADNADQALDLPQVHALNILRTIFMDAKLGTDILPYLSDGLSLAIDGFSSPSWAVRNCSVMLFSTLLQRTFGTKKTKDEHNSMNNLTSREFFTRFPHLLRYLLRELEIAVKQLLMDQQVPRVHPGLYPILTLLSRLHPALMDESDTELTMTSFVPLVMSCASSSIFKTREMTARALVPLIASTNLVPTVIRVLDSCSLTSQNELHGRLLQVQFLLRGHLYNVTSHEVMEDFVTHLPRVIASKLDILMPANPCNITRALMLDIITEFFIDSRWINLHIGDDKQDLIKSIAQKFADVRGAVFNQCAKEMFNGDNNKPGLSVGHYLLRQQMAKIIVLSVWSGLSYLSDILATDAVMKLLGDDDYEVRLVTLELLNKYMVAGPVTRYARLDLSILQRKLVRMIFSGESHLDCLRISITLLTRVNPQEPYPTEGPLEFSLELFWKRLVQHMDLKKGSAIVEATLPLLGSLLSQIWTTTPSHHSKMVFFQTWSAYIVKYSHEDVSLPLREATVASIRFVARHLLPSHHHDEQESEPIISVNLVITRLLQDDDVDIRDDMAHIVSKVREQKVPVHPERAVELVFSYLTHYFPSSYYLRSTLINMMFGEESLSTISEEELNPSRVLFARESSNIYKEDLLDAQWGFKSMQRLQYHRETQAHQQLSLNSFLEDLPDFFHHGFDMLETLNSLLSSDVIKEKNLGPLGFTARPRVFLPTYRVIIALLKPLMLLESPIFLNAIHNFDVEKEMQDLGDLLQKLERHSFHPLLDDLLFGQDGLIFYIDKLASRPRDWREHSSFSTHFHRLFLMGHMENVGNVES